jgi:hypothetical protein
MYLEKKQEGEKRGGGEASFTQQDADAWNAAAKKKQEQALPKGGGGAEAR